MLFSHRIAAKIHIMDSSTRRALGRNARFRAAFLRDFIKAEIRQHGVVAVRDIEYSFLGLYGIELPPQLAQQQMAHLERRGVLTRLGHGAYAFPGMPVDEAALRQAAAPGRSKVLDLLVSRARVMPTRELARLLEMKPGTVYQHTAKLHAAGLIRRAKHPNWGKAGWEATVAAQRAAAPSPAPSIFD